MALTDTILAALDLTWKPLSGAETINKAEELRCLVKAYSHQFPNRPASLRPSPDEDVVLVSGTTSGFGCDILSHLLRDSTVKKIYAFNRRGLDVAARQRKSFQQRGLDETELLSPKFQPIEGDLSIPGFGIDAQLFSEVCRSLVPY